MAKYHLISLRGLYSCVNDSQLPEDASYAYRQNVEFNLIWFTESDNIPKSYSSIIIIDFVRIFQKLNKEKSQILSQKIPLPCN